MQVQLLAERDRQVPSYVELGGRVSPACVFARVKAVHQCLVLF